jgi:hypothetical protein
MRFHKSRITPRLASDKLSQMVRCDSCLEKDFFIQLDFDPAVIAWRAHPFQISYLYKGRLRRYTPDALVLRRKVSGMVYQVVEVTSIYLLAKDEVARTLEVGERLCSDKGWEYRVVTEREIRSGHFLENIKRIRRYRSQRPPLQYHLAIRESLSSMGGQASIVDLADAVRSLNTDRIIPYIYWLLYNRELFADLQSPLTRGTLVRATLVRR